MPPTRPALTSLPVQLPVFPDLKGKIAIVTGIGQTEAAVDDDLWGNGAAIARVLCHNGVKVIGCDLKLEAAEKTKQRLIREDPDAVCEARRCDVTKSAHVEDLVASVVERYGRVDILVNNVGAARLGWPHEMSEDVWMQQMDINLHSVFRCCRAVLPIMERQGGGTIVNNASITALRYIGKPQIAYATAKAAVVRYTKSAGVMYAPKKIRMNCVVPGLMYTPLVQSFRTSNSEMFRRITQHNVPLQTMGSAFDVANACAFLVSDSAQYITAQALIVDGGLTEGTGTDLAGLHKSQL